MCRLSLEPFTCRNTMAFTETQLQAQLDPTSQKRGIRILRYIDNGTLTDVYVMGKIFPYAGKARWCTVSQALTAAAAATSIQNQLMK